MKTMYTLPQMAEELQRQNDAKVDYVADTREMHVVTEDGVTTMDLVGSGSGEDAQEMKVLPLAHNQIGNHLGIPGRYYDRMRTENPALLDHNVMSWFQREPSRRMLRCLDGDVRAFLSDRYRRIDNWEIAQAALPILGNIPDVRFESCALTDTRMYIKAVTPSVTGEVKVGDEVCAGVVIQNSEVGSGALSAQPFVFRLACTNGMVLPGALGMRRVHLGRRVEASEDTYALLRDETLRADDQVFLMALRDVIAAAVDEVRFRDAISEMQKALDGEKIKDPLAAVEVLAKREGLGEHEQRNVLLHLAEGGDLSRWGMLNAVTRTAEDVQDYDRASDLEVMGGKILGYSERDWQMVASAA